MPPTGTSSLDTARSGSLQDARFCVRSSVWARAHAVTKRVSWTGRQPLASGSGLGKGVAGGGGGREMVVRMCRNRREVSDIDVWVVFDAVQGQPTFRTPSRKSGREINLDG